MSSISCCAWTVVERNSAREFLIWAMRWSLIFMILLAVKYVSVRRCECGKRFPAYREIYEDFDQRHKSAIV